jgi:soluble lytic murein transglycosylase-like protein
MRDGNKTVVVLGDRCRRRASPLQVQYPGSDGHPLVARFAERLVVGRDLNCDVKLQDQGISRQHLEIYPDTNGWWVKDLGSSNGTYLDGKRIQQSPLPTDATIGFFDGGPVIKVSWKPSEPPSKDDGAYPERPAPAASFASSDNTRSGKRLRTGNESAAVPNSHIEHMARTHRRRFAVGMAAMALLLTAALGIIFYQYRDREEVLTLASEIFYQTKSLELELSRLRQELSKRPGAEMPAAVRETNRRLRDMQQRYASFTEEMKLIGSHRSKEDLLIFRVARVFGEYDLNIPDDFIQEVNRYIRKWQQSGRLEQAMSRINSRGQGQRVARAMLERDLPPQFLYLAVQESNFRADAVGPMTRFGIPKGMWQFLPQTATEYGLTVGPKRERRIFDQKDDRFDFHKSTGAAADYLRFLYTTEAQGSGLLVMSAYNWGHGNLRRKLDRLPQNPAERNFWRLLQSQQIPDETYDYVLSIVAAAVIGEDPKHFGFSFENPLAGL